MSPFCLFHPTHAGKTGAYLIPLLEKVDATQSHVQGDFQWGSFLVLRLGKFPGGGDKSNIWWGGEGYSELHSSFKGYKPQEGAQRF